MKENANLLPLKHVVFEVEPPNALTKDGYCIEAAKQEKT